MTERPLIEHTLVIVNFTQQEDNPLFRVGEVDKAVIRQSKIRDIDRLNARLVLSSTYWYNVQLDTGENVLCHEDCLIPYGVRSYIDYKVYALRRA